MEIYGCRARAGTPMMRPGDVADILVVLVLILRRIGQIATEVDEV